MPSVAPAGAAGALGEGGAARRGLVAGGLARLQA